jgi:hypothetical protein
MFTQQHYTKNLTSGRDLNPGSRLAAWANALIVPRCLIYVVSFCFDANANIEFRAFLTDNVPTSSN